ncbi:hypothetical protein NW754_001533 [Fusarium falciforme]|uniref:Uncharacterized protein n=1 Tax=Fusarium falciforme TaxID=195108 RepID=A0A9W8QS33_9HYPO|nr:hypothetical protein NW754_001533 [Fusarium falciforme]KAJ4176587.1 hypothetical protein NW755_014334 [Fusarium falciforme]KAJ4176865.1 hypothetical protein NW767_015300 [Fusarium falciforme]KAJ4227333.1 hypothetical protein NW757_014208 [Fusarium falciforme]
MVTVAILGTCDTKLEELVFLRDQILQHGERIKTLLIDVGRKDCQHDAIDIRRSTLVKQYGDGSDGSELPRGELIKCMARCAAKLIKQLYANGSIHGIIASGGSGGTSLASNAMKNVLPVGFPKLIVSTVASGDTSSIVGESDMTLMYSVVDVAGLNDLLKQILGNAGGAIAGMSLSYARRKEEHQKTGPRKKRVGSTMFGVTTPGVDAIRAHLQANYPVEVYVFHATGHGGRAMEKLINDGQLDAVLDLTTTEVCDMITGGIMAAAPDRFDAAIKAGIPNIVSLGATDMSNFGPKSTVPEKYQNRKLFEHNPMTTLMRTSEDESRQVGEFIAQKLKASKDPAKVQLWIPCGGVSAMATPNGQFADPGSDAVLFDTVKGKLEGSGIKIVEDQRDINDPGFAKEIAEALASLMGLK